MSLLKSGIISLQAEIKDQNCLRRGKRVSKRQNFYWLIIWTLEGPTTIKEDAFSTESCLDYPEKSKVPTNLIARQRNLDSPIERRKINSFLSLLSDLVNLLSYIKAICNISRGIRKFSIKKIERKPLSCTILVWMLE